jgi:hypothetical protein
VIARTVSTHPVEVRRPGSYYVTARLPAGQELFGQVRLYADRDATVVLSPRGRVPSAAAPIREGWAYLASSAAPARFAPDARKMAERSRSIDSRGIDFEVDLGDDAEDDLDRAVRLRAFVGNVLAGRPEEIEPPPGDVTVEGGVTRMLLDGWPRGSADGPVLLQLVQPFAAPVNVALPLDLTAPGANRCSLYLRSAPDGHVSVEPHLQDPTADLLVRFLTEELLQEAATAIQFDAIPSERLLRDKMADPVGAAVGAYALLRFGELGRLRDWTDNLRILFPSLPDGAAIRGEHLARAGQHHEALGVFLELAERGLPIFTAGFFYAVDRLELYIRVTDSTFTPAEQSAAESLLGQLNRFVPYVDRKAAFLTYPGADPRQPSPDPIGGQTGDTGGRDISDALQR